MRKTFPDHLGEEGGGTHLFAHNEATPQYDWRSYVRDPGSIPAEYQEKLDALAAHINAAETDDAKEFLEIFSGKTDRVFGTDKVGPLIQHFRYRKVPGIELTETDAHELFSAVSKAGIKLTF